MSPMKVRKNKGMKTGKTKQKTPDVMGLPERLNKNFSKFFHQNEMVNEVKFKKNI